MRTRQAARLWAAVMQPTFILGGTIGWPRLAQNAPGCNGAWADVCTYAGGSPIRQVHRSARLPRLRNNSGSNTLCIRNTTDKVTIWSLTAPS